MKRLILFELIVLFLATTFESDSPPGWFEQVLPVNDIVNDIFFIDTLNGWAVSDGNNFGSDTSFTIRTTNGGNNWNIQFSVTNKLKAMQFTDITTGYLVGGTGTGTGRVYKTTNSGNNWNLIFTSGVIYEDLFFINKDTGWICDKDNFLGAGLQKTTNGGASWFQQLTKTYSPSKLFFLNKDTGWVACNFSGVGTARELYRTTNGGTNWDLQFTSAFAIEAIFFLTSQKGWMRGGTMTGTNGISYSTNGGFNWTDSQGEIGGFDIKFVNDSIGFTGKQSFRIAKSTDGGKNWGYQNVPIGNSMSVSVLKNDSMNVWGAGSGVIHTTDGGGQIFLGITQIGNEIPSDFKLYQNYPNPFNPKTNIKYQITKSKYVRLVVYDIQGKEVTTLVNQAQNEGTYVADWNASDISSGIYFYSLIVDGRLIDSRKMLLIK